MKSHYYVTIGAVMVLLATPDDSRTAFSYASLGQSAQQSFYCSLDDSMTARTCDGCTPAESAIARMVVS